MSKLARFRTFSALTSVVMAIILAFFLLLVSQSVSQAAKPPLSGDTTPPTVSTVYPANNATGVGLTINVEATFSEAMNASTINDSTFTLTTAGTTTPVAAQISYSSATNQATLDPNTDLAPGTTYTATVKGGNKGVKDLAGNWLRSNSTWSFTTAAAPPPQDTTPPDTTIDSGPSGTVSDSSASFTFSSSEPNSTFECSLDGAAYSSCISPQTYSGLTNGSHTFSVRAIDAAGNVDPTPASHTWMIDTTSPPPNTGCPTGQVLAEYYNNMTLSGSPVLTRCEAAINNTWDTGGPGGGVATDNFSVRWNGIHSFEAGDYTFTATSDDGIRVWVDSELIIDGWKDQAPTTYTATRTLTAGDHQIKVEYYENLEVATAQLSWQRATSPPPPSDTPLIALTFDDGPDPEDTPKILDILRFHNVKATFFVSGRETDTYPDIVRREHQEGHMVGNHAYTHRPLTTLSEAEVREELENTNTAITAAGAPQPNLFRPPYADTNAMVENIATSLGMTQTLWNFNEQIGDHENPPPEEICDRAVRDAQPGAIMLLHDGGLANNTDDALDCIITRLKAQGYSFGLIYPSSTYNSLNSSYVVIR